MAAPGSDDGGAAKRESEMGLNRAKAMRAEAGGDGKPSMDVDPPFPEDGWDYAGINSMAPPCLRKSTKGRACMEYAPCCRCVGRIGPAALDAPVWRKRLLSVAVVINVASLAFVLLAVCALASSYDTVRTTAWTKGVVSGLNTTELSVVARQPVTQAADLHLYIGLSGVAVEIKALGSGEDLVTRYDEWDSSSMCQGPTAAVQNFCENCKDAALATVVPAIMAVVTMLPTLQTDVQRMFRRYDLHCQKFLAVFVGGIFGCLSTLASFNVFLASCRDALPHSLALGGSQAKVATWSAGVAFQLVMAATFLKLVDAGIHFAIPTPKAIWPDREGRIAANAGGGGGGGGGGGAAALAGDLEVGVVSTDNPALRGQ